MKHNWEALTGRITHYLIYKYIEFQNKFYIAENNNNSNSYTKYNFKKQS